MPKLSSQDQQDTAQFDAIGDAWWASSGPMAPLHAFTPVRIDYIQEMAKRAGFGTHDGALPLHGCRILDIGCGGGLLAEPLAQLGADMTAIDASQAAISAARAHASKQGLAIDYRHCLAEDLAETGVQFDIIYSSEVIEHVANRSVFLSAMSQLLKPGGLFVITTINRTMAALATIKIGAEYIVKMIPKGTHDYAKFVTPAELTAECAAHGLLVDHHTGFAPSPKGGFRKTRFQGINYAVSGRKG